MKKLTNLFISVSSTIYGHVHPHRGTLLKILAILAIVLITHKATLLYSKHFGEEVSCKAKLK